MPEAGVKGPDKEPDAAAAAAAATLVPASISFADGIVCRGVK